MGVAEKASNSQTQSAEAVDISGVSVNQEQILALKAQLEKLTIKFDIAVAKTESVLTTAQTAMQYDNYVLTALGVGVAIFAIGVAVVIAWLQYRFNIKKEEAIDEAKKEIEHKIVQGVLPDGSSIKDELLKNIFDSDEFLRAIKSAEFIDSVKSVKKFINDGIEAGEAWAEKEGIKSEEITIPTKGFKHKNKN